MKVTKLFLASLVCFTAVFGSCKTGPQRIPVSNDFLRTREQDEIQFAKFYISADTEFIVYNNKEYDRVGSDGIHYKYTVYESKPVLIKKDDPGKIEEPFEKNNYETVEVNFPKDEDIISLTFMRVRNTNLYELSSARIGTIRLDLPTFKFDKPLLQIDHISGPNPNQDPNKKDSSEGDSQPSYTSDISNVLGKGNLTIANKEAIANFIYENRKFVSSSDFNRSSVVEIIEFYFEEAEREGINPDFAIAALIQNLQYFSDSKRFFDFRKAHNYGAIENLKGFKTAYWDGSSFISRQIGIRAHIQFIKRLASGNLNDGHTIVLPNWNNNGLVKAAGTRKTLDEISRSWGGSAYAKNIRNIYTKLFEHISANR